jgi:hypothetical protein
VRCTTVSSRPPAEPGVSNARQVIKRSLAIEPLRLCPPRAGAKHPTQLYIAGTLSRLVLGALAISYAPIAMLVTGRSWVVATVAALLGGIGAFCGAIVNVLVGVNFAAAATARISPDAAARFLMTSFNYGAGQLFTYLYFVSEYTAPVVMGARVRMADRRAAHS